MEKTAKKKAKKVPVKKRAANVKKKPAQDVDGFMRALRHPHKDGVEMLRQLILGMDPHIREEVKWNAPSFRIDDNFATFRLFPPHGIQLVLHHGTRAHPRPKAFKVADPHALLKWAAPDRAVLQLESSDAARAHLAAVRHILEQWMAQL